MHEIAQDTRGFSGASVHMSVYDVLCRLRFALVDSGGLYDSASVLRLVL